MYCKKCGNQISESSDYCEKCGTKTQEERIDRGFFESKLAVNKILFLIMGIVWFINMFVGWSAETIGEAFVFRVINSNGMFAFLRYIIGIGNTLLCIILFFGYGHSPYNKRNAISNVIVGILVPLGGNMLLKMLSTSDDIIWWQLAVVVVGYSPAWICEAVLNIVNLILLHNEENSSALTEAVRCRNYSRDYSQGYSLAVKIWLAFCLIAAIISLAVCIWELANIYWLLLMFLYIFRIYAYLGIMNKKKKGMYSLIVIAVIEAMVWTAFIGFGVLTFATFVNPIITGIVISKYWKYFK